MVLDGCLGINNNVDGGAIRKHSKSVYHAMKAIFPLLKTNLNSFAYLYAFTTWRTETS